MFGRGERIWTSGLFVPNEARYQAAPHLDSSYINDLAKSVIRENQVHDGFAWRIAPILKVHLEFMD